MFLVYLYRIFDLLLAFFHYLEPNSYHISSCTINIKHYTYMTELTHCDLWQHRSRLTLAQVMAWCLMAPSHYLNQCLLIISEGLWHSLEGRSLGNNPGICHWDVSKNHTINITSTSPRGQWVNGKLWYLKYSYIVAGVILGLHPVNERCRYKVTPSLIGWAKT